MKRKALLFTTLTLLASMSVVACGGGDDPSEKQFDFSVAFEKSGNNVLFANSPDNIRISEKNPESGKSYSYTITFSGDDFSEADPVDDYVTAEFATDSKGKYFAVTPLKSTDERTITASIKEASVKKPRSLFFTIKAGNIEPANAGYNYAAANDEESRQTRLEILGELEKYAMENYLTGITLFENGGYVRYSDRIKVKATEYITGYGWGILSEGTINGLLPNVTVEPTYLQSASSSDPLTINAWDATGSQVSDLNSYISTSYWGTRMKGTTKYEWYPVLAKDKVTIKGVEQDNLRPIAQDLDPNNKTGLYKVWRIYVKTGKGNEGGLKYRTNSSKMASYNNRLVALEDYEFVYQMLLSERSQLVRGAELAGDTSYGIKGGQAFFRKSKNMTDNDKLDKLWKDMQDSGELGIRTGVDDVNGSYIELELVNPIDEFTAMYTLSSNLYNPMPKAFIKAIGGGDYTEGARLFGTFPSVGGSSQNAIDYTLCLGPYYLKNWEKNQETVFARNDDWFEYTPGGARYQIPGVRIKVMTDIVENASATWQRFNNGELDSTNIPKDELPNVDLSKERKSGGDSTFKLNVNSCDQDEWNRLFGTNGVIKQGKDNEYKVKPWMSNKNFLKGLYWSINREKFAKDRGVTPSFSYFSGAYMSDPENGISYNSTNEHLAAVDAFHNVVNGVDDYGYDVDTAIQAFSDAVNELVTNGDIELGSDKQHPTIIRISIEWMYQTDIRDYGKDIVADFQTAFNDDRVCGGLVQLEVDQDAVAQWDQVYNDYLMVGKYDLGFGAISGNTYNPLNFMEVLKSDNSSGFTLNWGTNTGVIDERSPIEYDGKLWSFDALWAAADHGTVVTQGRDVSPVVNAYVKSYTSNTLYSGANINVPFSFTEVDPTSVAFGVDKDKDVQLYLLGAGTIRPGDKDEHGTEYFSVEKTSEGYKIVITPAGGEALNQLLVDANDLEKEAAKKTDPEEQFKILHPFTAQNYNIYWNIEIHYTISINGGQPSENVVYVYRDYDQQESDRK